MMMRTYLLLALALTTGVAQAQMYRWVDDQGRVRYTDTPPPASAKGSRTVKPGGAAEPAAKPAAAEQKPGNAALPEGVFYTNSGCGQLCAEARAYLNSRGAKFREVEVESAESLEQLRKATGGMSVPAFALGGAVQNGYDLMRYERMLDSAGYPKAGAAKPAAAQPQTPPAPRGRYSTDAAPPQK